MLIEYINFQNYRNLNNLKIVFSPDINFVIGENGIGKSNVLYALNRIFSNGRFFETDFDDKDKNIVIDICLSLYDEEIGVFDEYTDPSNHNRINLIIKQGIEDSAFKVYHLETEDEIPPRLLKNIFYMYYDSLRNPKTELNFDREKGSGKFLNFLIKKYLGKHEEADSSYIDKDKLSSVLTFINDNICKMNAVKRSAVNVDIDTDNLSFLNSVFQLYDSNKIELKKSGYGIQFSLLVIFSLFERIIEITTKAQKAGKLLTSINCILAFDEPEIHLHPFAQRALVKDLKAIVNGKDEGFNNIIKDLFGIDSIVAQLIFVSHSNSIILGGYENIVRLYSDGCEIKSVSGRMVKKVHAEELKKDEKHLQKMFPYFCEAMFAKKVVFVEGDCELGALNVFAQTLHIDTDNCGIYIINASGGESVNTLIKIFSLFQIECIGIKDRDVYDKNKNAGQDTSDDDQLINNGKLILTHEQNFEFEIVKAFANLDDLYSYLSNWDKSYIVPKQKGNVNKFINNFNLSIPEINGDLRWEDCDDEKKKLFLLVALSNIKTITAGAILAEALSEDKIPQVYKEVLEKVINNGN